MDATGRIFGVWTPRGLRDSTHGLARGVLSCARGCRLLYLLSAEGDDNRFPYKEDAHVDCDRTGLAFLLGGLRARVSLFSRLENGTGYAAWGRTEASSFSRLARKQTDHWSMRALSTSSKTASCAGSSNHR